MSDSEAAPAAPTTEPAPSAPLAPAPEPDGRYDADVSNVYTSLHESEPADTRAALDALSANEKWRADFSGANGRDSQRHAVAHKSRLIQQREAPAEAAANVAGPTSGDYHFQFEGARDMDPEVHSAMHTEIGEIAHALGADPQSAKSVVEHVDQFIARNPNAQPPADVATIEAEINRRFGPENTVVANAKAAINRIPEGPQRQRVLDAFDHLDLNMSVFLIGKLAGQGGQAHG